MTVFKLFAAFLIGCLLVVLTAPLAIAGEVHVIPSATNNNLSGDYRCTSPDGRYLQFLRAGQWHVRDLDADKDLRLPIARTMKGATNDELMWGPGGDLYWLDGKYLCQGQVSGSGVEVLSRRLQLPDISVRKWIAGSSSCDELQFVRGWTDQGDYIQPFDAAKGELLPGWWAADASGGKAPEIRNCVTFPDDGFLISHRGPLAYRECWYSADGTQSVVPLEPAGEGNRNYWSHQATCGDRLTYFYPFYGRIETTTWHSGQFGPTRIVADQERLRQIAGTEDYTAWQHGSCDASRAVFSMICKPDEGPTRFHGIFSLALESGDISDIWLAPPDTVLPSKFADMPRPGLQKGWVCWQHDANSDGETDLHYMRIDSVPPPDDQLADRVNRIELFLQQTFREFE